MTGKPVLLEYIELLKENHKIEQFLTYYCIILYFIIIFPRYIILQLYSYLEKESCVNQSRCGGTRESDAFTPRVFQSDV